MFGDSVNFPNRSALSARLGVLVKRELVNRARALDSLERKIIGLSIRVLDSAVKLSSLGELPMT